MLSIQLPLCRISADFYFPVVEAIYSLGYEPGELFSWEDKWIVKDKRLVGMGIWESREGYTVLQKAKEIEAEKFGGSKFYRPPKIK